MKKTNIISAILLAASLVFGLAACNKYNSISTPSSFSVSTAKLTYRVGDSIFFNFAAPADEITFYSGESGKQYANINRNIAAGGSNKLVFQTSMQQGTLPNNDSLRLLISSNLNGYDSVSVGKATWTDITSRNTKWPTTLATSFVTSDSVDISDFNSKDSINIAFRFIGKNYPTAAQRKWQIQGFALTNNLPDGTLYQLFSTPYAGSSVASAFKYTGWVQANLITNYTNYGYNAWNVGTANISTADSVRNSNGIAIATAYPLKFDPGAAVNASPNDSWVISTKTSLKTIRPDAGTTIKNIVNAAFAGMTYVYYNTPGVYASYLYKYTAPGVYNITFVATNLNQDKSSQVVKQLQLTITP